MHSIRLDAYYVPSCMGRRGHLRIYEIFPPTGCRGCPLASQAAHGRINDEEERWKQENERLRECKKGAREQYHAGEVSFDPYIMVDEVYLH